MFLSLCNNKIFLRLLAAIVVSCVLLQSSFATHVISHFHDGQVAREACASSSFVSDGVADPSFPGEPAGHHDYCCILHEVSASVCPRFSNAFLIGWRPFEAIAGRWLAGDGPVRPLYPSSAPQSPRAPPVFGLIAPSLAS